ncbi:MAG TPA: GTPase [Acidobacteriota bacterium]|nr:GTPase [Acidobacteriota bacterium]
MPANLPPQYYELEREFRAEKDPRERLRLAQELLKIMPKHKGTDKLQADLKAKIAKLKKQIEGGDRQHGAHQAPAHDYIPSEGAGQIVLIGPPNCGKSSLVDVLTNATPLVTDYPYATREPLAAMMTFETVQIQLIDTPPISHDLYENYMSNLVRNADLVALVCDLSNPAMNDNLSTVLRQLEEKRILLRPRVEEQPEDPRFCAKKTIFIAHKAYEDESGEKRAFLAGRFPGFAMFATSIIDDESLQALRRGMFEALGIIRIYTKQVGKEAELVNPVILPIGGTVEDAALSIHKDFAQRLKFAKVWGVGKFDGQRVHRDYRLSDGDIVEFHI